MGPIERKMIDFRKQFENLGNDLIKPELKPIVESYKEYVKTHKPHKFNTKGFISIYEDDFINAKDPISRYGAGNKITSIANSIYTYKAEENKNNFLIAKMQNRVRECYDNAVGGGRDDIRAMVWIITHNEIYPYLFWLLKDEYYNKLIPTTEDGCNYWNECINELELPDVIKQMYTVSKNNEGVFTFNKNICGIPSYDHLITENNHENLNDNDITSEDINIVDADYKEVSDDETEELNILKDLESVLKKYKDFTGFNINENVDKDSSYPVLSELAKIVFDTIKEEKNKAMKENKTKEINDINIKKNEIVESETVSSSNVAEAINSIDIINKMPNHEQYVKNIQEWEKFVPGLNKVTEVIHELGNEVQYGAFTDIDWTKMFYGTVIDPETGVSKLQFEIDPNYIMRNNSLNIIFNTRTDGNIYRNTFVPVNDRKRLIECFTKGSALSNRDGRKITKANFHPAAASVMERIHNFPNNLSKEDYNKTINSVMNAISDRLSNLNCFYHMSNYVNPYSYTLEAMNCGNPGDAFLFVNKNIFEEGKSNVLNGLIITVSGTNDKDMQIKYTLQ